MEDVKDHQRGLRSIEGTLRSMTVADIYAEKATESFKSFRDDLEKMKKIISQHKDHKPGPWQYAFVTPETTGQGL